METLQKLIEKSAENKFHADYHSNKYEWFLQLRVSQLLHVIEAQYKGDKEHTMKNVLANEWCGFYEYAKAIQLPKYIEQETLLFYNTVKDTIKQNSIEQDNF